MTSSTPAIPTATTPDTGAARRRLFRAASIIGSALLAWAILLIATAGAGVEVVAPGPAGMAPVTGPAVLVATLVAGLLGWAALATLERIAPRRGRTWWTVLAIVVGVLSTVAGPPAAATPAATGVLAALHVVVTAGIILGLRLAARTSELSEVRPH